MFATESNIKRARSKKESGIKFDRWKNRKKRETGWKMEEKYRSRGEKRRGGSRSNDLNVQFDETRRAFFEDGNNEAGARDCN